VSTPTGKPSRPASAFDYAPKRLRDQWDRDDASDGADAESPSHLPRDLDEDPSPKQARHREDARSSLVPQGPHEHADDKWTETDDAPALGWEDEPAHRPDAHDRHAETAAGDNAYEEQYDEEEEEEEYEEPEEQPHEARHADVYDEPLERLAATLRSLQPDAGTATPKLPPAPQIRPATRGFHAHPTDAAEREVYIDGTRLPRFLQASYVPPSGREGGVGVVGAMLAAGIGILLAAPLTYYVAFGNPFALTRDIQAKPTLQYAVASTSTSLPRPEQQSQEPASIVAPNAPAAPAASPQLEPKQFAALPSLEPQPQAQAPASPRPPRSVPLTHVVRWPDAGQGSGAAEPPRTPSFAPTSEPPRANALAPMPIPAPAPAPAPALALAPASPPAPARPAPPRPPVHNADEIDL
jgi:hypothetical protein